MNKIYRRMIQIGKLLLHPKQIIFGYLPAVIRHLKFPSCSATAIVYKPILFTPRNTILEDKVYISKNARIETILKYAGEIFNPELRIGYFTSISQNAHITCAKKILIGSDCAITHNVTITDIDHSFEYSPSNTPPILLTIG